MDKSKEIQEVENRYGQILFRMGLIHLVDVGMRQFNDVNAAEVLKQIEAETKDVEDQSRKSFISPEIKREIVNCATELAKFSPMELFIFINKYFIIE